MGLLDSVIGAINNTGTHAGNGNATAAGGAAGLGGLLGTLASNPQVVQAIIGMLSNDGGQGGLGGLIAKFQQAGMGDKIQSWIGSGDNLPVTGSEMEQALGGDTVANLATQMGTSKGDAASQLAQLLPGLVNQLTPAGQVPDGDVGNSSDLMGALSGLLGKA